MDQRKEELTESLKDFWLELGRLDSQMAEVRECIGKLVGLAEKSPNSKFTADVANLLAVFGEEFADKAEDFSVTGAQDCAEVLVRQLKADS